MVNRYQGKTWIRSLRARLVAHFLILSLLIVALAGYLAFFGARRALEQSVFDRLSVVADLEEDQLRRWVKTQRQEVVFLASLPEMQMLAEIVLEEPPATRPLAERDNETRDGVAREDLTRDDAYRRLHEILSLAIDLKSGLREVLILSTVGGRIAVSTNPTHEGEYRIRDSFFLQGRADTYVQNVYPSPLDFKPTLTISTPLNAPDGSLQGVLAANLNLDELDQLVPSVGLGESSETYLVDKYNDFVSGTRFGRERFARGVHTEGIDAAIAGRDGSGLYANYEGVQVLGVYRWIEDLDLALLVEISQREAFAPARQIVRLILGVGLGLALLLTAGTVILAYQMSRPIRQISEAALQVAIGNLDASAPVVTRDEIGVLARSFNEMTRRLRKLYKDLKQEIAEHQLAQEELEAKNAELERFTYTVSHDLKSPLVTIKGFLGMLEKDTLAGDQDRMRSDIERIKKAAETMNRLLDELLELSRVGRQVNPPEELSLGELAQQAVELLAGDIAERGVEVEVAPDLPVILGDRVRLLEVLQNLVANAVKFMGDQPEPRIEIGVRRDGEGEIFYVSDNGVGIDPQYQEKVFGLFERLDVGVAGTGVGLALVKRIIELHNGEIWVESAGKGHGSTFCFTLSAHADSEEGE